MDIQKQIKEYIATQSEPKRSEMQQLNDMILALEQFLSSYIHEERRGLR